MQHAEEFFAAAMVAQEAGWSEACRGLITAGIVAYARPFSGNEKHPETNPSPSFSLRYLTNTERSLHARIIELRNKAVAHSDADQNPVRVDACASNALIFSPSFYDPLVESPNLPAMQALAKTARHLLVGGSLNASRAIASESEQPER
ncbi:hypothetical protein Xkhy_05785 [Xanthomonas axonopodis pv. khayae]|uniref:hypothetical protein n=1 Tax=Xanthomonas TaxID=338 RepID=UPI00052878D0|nr:MULTISPECIES: hypothetical protein [Xanthomonas]KHS06746.1 hypothetical protein RM61_14275 [Xanthomonas phaseoli pv. phaseoli]OOW60692.1 hypothetical protein Xths_18610 [Xanthomonas campestris pv. thespesiae]OOW75230.1 hypothetical protein Xlen_20330 [Xanthomonas campestris pv. leeana]OOX21778.1 hypothetical protein Xazr_04220 [Xanthomonas campestris pv. azadirachtae]CEJ48965.1 conserved hypothetical protein [Xanthomonas citri pv. bilvae]